ncbi:MAG TPA: APC family permease [Solirubrobacteraceae bacterium]|nr:APC family permease [Solirubrobacteraceae bacterium]
MRRLVPRQLRPSTSEGTLRRDLGFWGTWALGVGGMAPTLAMSVTGVQASRLLGQAAPLAYVLAGIGMVFIGYGFVRLSAAFSHAGSVYAYIGKTLGPRSGFFTTWALLGTYIVFPPVSILGMAVFTQAFLRHAGIAESSDWLPIALASWLLVWLLASRGVKMTAASVVAVEIVSLALIVALMVVIVVALGGDDAPRGQTLGTEVFDVPEGVGLATIALAATFGILSFGGFESAMSVGEESHRPRRLIPGSIAATVAFGATFYVACIATQTLGFGTDEEGVAAFAGSGSPLGDLARSYVGTAMAALLDVGAVLSSVGAALVGVAVMSRTLFALGRDRVFPGYLAAISDRTGTPIAAVTTSMALTLVQLVVFGVAGTSALDAFFYLATIGTLSLLVIYIVVSVSALRLVLGRRGLRARLEIVLPVGGAFVAGYVLYRNLIPVPDHPFNLFPYIVAGWLVAGLAISVFVAGLAERISARLAAS